MEENSSEDGTWMDLDDVAPELAEELGTVPLKASIALLDGREVEGPFHRAGPAGPLVEIWEAEVDSSSGRPRARRVGMVNRLPHTAGPEDLLTIHGPGVWVCLVRGARGQVLGQQWIATGTRAQRERVALQAERRAESPHTDESPIWLQQLLQRQKEEGDELRRQVAELREAERKRAEADQRRLEQELAELRAEVKKSRAAPPPPVDADPVGAIKRKLSEAKEIRELLAEDMPEPEEPEKDFLDEANDTMGALMGQYGKIAGLMDKFAEGE